MISKCFILALLLYSHSLYAYERNERIDDKNIILIKEAFKFQYRYGPLIWKEWKNENYPLCFKTTEFDYLINHPNPPSDFSKKYYDERLLTTVWIRKNLDTLSFFAAYPINEEWTIIITEPTKDYNKGLWLLKFAHESFHVFQHQMRAERIVNPFTDKYAIYHELSFPFDYDSKSLMSAMRLEAEKIFNSVNTESLNDLDINITKKLFKHYQIILQQVTQDESHYKYKQWIEWNEGVARYTEYKLAQIAKESTAAKVSTEFLQTFPETDFTKIWEENYNSTTHLNPIRFIGEGVRGRMCFYYSGMGKAYYLDRVKENWKNDYFKKNLDELIIE